MKKTIALAIVLALVLAFAAPAFATPTLPVQITQEGKVEGKTLTLIVSIAENNEACSGKFTLNYNKDVLTFNKIKKSSTLDMGLVEKNTDEAGVIIYGFAKSAPICNEDEEPAGGDMFTLIFDIKDTFTDGVLTSELICNELIDESTTNKLATVVGYMADGKFVESAKYDVTVGTPAPTTAAPTTAAPTTPVVTNTAEVTTPVVTNTAEVTNTAVVTDTAEVTNTADATVAPTNKPENPKTGGMTLVAVAAISAIAGLGALTLRKKED